VHARDVDSVARGVQGMRRSTPASAYAGPRTRAARSGGHRLRVGRERLDSRPGSRGLNGHRDGRAYRDAWPQSTAPTIAAAPRPSGPATADRRRPRSCDPSAGARGVPTSAGPTGAEGGTTASVRAEVARRRGSPASST
jgi:hypothetical protein